MRILIVESDQSLAQFLRNRFRAQQSNADVAADGDAARELAQQDDYDLMILDLKLPQADAFDLLRDIRSRHASLPVLALSPAGDFEQRVRAFDAGADSFLPKPFAFAELLAQARALMRRAHLHGNPILHVGDLELNRLERHVSRAGKLIDLTPKEFALLEYLMQNEGECVSRASIIEHVWKLASETMTNIVDVYINYLRKKIDEPFDCQLIQTVRGRGYRIGTAKEKQAMAATA